MIAKQINISPTILKQGKEVPTTDTTLQGYIACSYTHIVDVLGPPEAGSSDNKTTANWSIKFDDGIIATIYDWKVGTAYLGKTGITPEQVLEWCVGGYTSQALHNTQALLALDNESVLKANLKADLEQRKIFWKKIKELSNR